MARSACVARGGARAGDRPGQAPFEAWLPDRLAATSIAGANLAAWVSLGAIGAASLLAAAALFWALTWGLARIQRGGRHEPLGRVIREAWVPLALIGGGILFQIGGFLVGVPVVARARVSPVVEIGSWIALAGCSGVWSTRRATRSSNA